MVLFLNKLSIHAGDKVMLTSSLDTGAVRTATGIVFPEAGTTGTVLKADDRFGVLFVRWNLKPAEAGKSRKVNKLSWVCIEDVGLMD